MVLVSRSILCSTRQILQPKHLRNLPFNRTMSGNDQYSATAGVEVSLSEKVSAFHGFMQKHKTVMLVTRAPSGDLHSRCMAAADVTKDLKIRFIYDRDSYKDKEVENDSHVNVAVDGMDKNDGWVSISGKAARIEEPDFVAKHYNPTIKAWFGDKGDGIHTGGPEDPRMAIIEVRPSEIRHFHQTRTSIGTAVDVIASTISGNTASPGEVRTISAAEIAQL